MLIKWLYMAISFSILHFLLESSSGIIRRKVSYFKLRNIELRPDFDYRTNRQSHHVLEGTNTLII